MSRPSRIVLGVLAALLVVYLLFTQVFPRIERYMDDPSLGATAATTVAVPPVVGPQG